MGAHQASTSVAAAARRKLHSERLATWQLEAALHEQARLGDAYERSVSTSAEQACYMRLEAASLDVSRCDKRLKTISATNG
jgi:hypothetical protein